MILTKVFNDLKIHKLRTTLTILGLAIAVIGIAGFPIITNSIKATVADQYGQSIDADLELSVRELTWNSSILENIEGIKNYEIGMSYYGTTVMNEEVENVDIRAVETKKISDGISILGVQVSEGKAPRHDCNEIMIDKFAADYLKLKIGDIFPLSFTINQTQVKTFDFTITGFSKDIESAGYTSTNYFSVFLDIFQLANITNNDVKINQIFIEYENIEDDFTFQDPLVQNLLEDMKNQGIYLDYVKIVDSSSSWRDEMLGNFQLSIIFASIMGLVVGGLLAASTIQMTIAQEKKDISLMRVIGGQSKQVFTIYLTEALVMGITGTLIGLGLTIGGSYLILEEIKGFYGLESIVFSPPLISILLGAISPVAISLLFSIPSITKVLKVKPVEYFQHNTKTLKGSGKSGERLLQAKYSWNNIRANKNRMLAIGFMLCFSMTSIVGFTVGVDNLNIGMQNVMDEFPSDIISITNFYEDQDVVTSIMDNFIANNTDLPEETVKEHASVLWEYPINKNDTLYEASISLVGIPLNTQMFQTLKLAEIDRKEGRLLEKADEGKNCIILSKKYVEDYQLNITIGENITLEDQLNKMEFTVIGFVYELMMQGYTDLKSMQNFYNAPNSINTVYIDLAKADDNVEISRIMGKDQKIGARGWSIISSQQMRDQYQQIGNMFTMINVMVNGLMLIVVIIGGVNIFTMALLERQREIGVLKIQGARPKWIFNGFLIESLLVCIIAGAVGIALGYFILGPIWTNIAQGASGFLLPYEPKLYVPFLSGGIVLLTAIFSSIYPGYKAARVSPIEGLRYE